MSGRDCVGAAYSDCWRQQSCCEQHIHSVQQAIHSPGVLSHLTLDPPLRAARPAVSLCFARCEMHWAVTGDALWGPGSAVYGRLHSHPPGDWIKDSGIMRQNSENYAPIFCPLCAKYAHHFNSV